VAVDPFAFPRSGPLPWDDADRAYAGWVPTVSGHLSFGLIDGRGRCSALSHRDSGTGSRVVVALQKRSAEDFPLPGRVVSSIRQSATQDYLLLAKTGPAVTPYIEGAKIHEQLEEQGVLSGVVLIVPPEEVSQVRIQRNALLDLVRNHVEDVADQCAINPDLDTTTLPLTLLQEFVSARGTIAFHQLKFALFRTGECRIWFDLSDLLGRDISQAPISSVEQIAISALPSQAYYFLKDVIHLHYHHDPQTDQLIDLVATEKTSSLDVRDNQWRIDTLRGLAKVVIEYRQSNRPDSNKKALGLLAYADAFQTTLARVRRQGKLDDPMLENKALIPYDFKHVRASIEALEALNEYRRGALLQLFGILVGVVLSGFALWAGAVQIQPILCNISAERPLCPKVTPGATTNIVNWVVANPLGFVVTLSLFGFAAFILFFRGVTNVPFAKPILRWSKQLSAAVGTTAARLGRGSDAFGFVIQLSFLGLLVIALGLLAYHLVPKNSVPPVVVRSPQASTGPWSALDPYIGRRPRDTGLFTNSIIAPELRDMLGSDYEEFLRLLDVQSPLQRGATLWVVGHANPEARDGAFLLIDQRAQRLEIGLRKHGNLQMYRKTGAILQKPLEVARFIGGSVADVGPFPIATSSCRSQTGGAAGNVTHLSGAMRGLEDCSYRFDLRQGQSLTYNPKLARGLEVYVRPDGSPEIKLSSRFLVAKTGMHTVRVAWERTGTPQDATRPLRPFYVRLNTE